jgi:hypothetical protein
VVAEEVSLFIVATLLQTVHISMPYFNNTTGRGEETEPSSRLDEETGIVYLSEGFGGGYVTASFKLPIGETLQITIGGGGNTEGSQSDSLGGSGGYNGGFPGKDDGKSGGGGGGGMSTVVSSAFSLSSNILFCSS